MSEEDFVFGPRPDDELQAFLYDQGIKYWIDYIFMDIPFSEKEKK